jgi:hypothetical protein
MDTHEALTKAIKSYEQNARDWKFLGYSQALAIAILGDFFLLKKVRNPSPKPLNVLSIVGKSRVVYLRQQIEASQRADAELAAEEAESGADVLESEKDTNEGG